MKKYDGIYNRRVKPMIDFPIALILIISLLPVILIISASILISSGRPVFYIAERCGYHGRIFKIYKFRTMIRDADQLGSGTSALHDKRVTKIGKILRKTKLDEMPQLFNILKGEMSFVGPRPELIRYTSRYSPEETVILEVRPGITDYSSLEFISLDILVGEQNADEVYENDILPAKNRLRMKYAETVSIQTDCKLLFITFIKVVHRIFCYIIHKSSS